MLLASASGKSRIEISRIASLAPSVDCPVVAADDCRSNPRDRADVGLNGLSGCGGPFGQPLAPREGSAVTPARLCESAFQRLGARPPRFPPPPVSRTTARARFTRQLSVRSDLRQSSPAQSIKFEAEIVNGCQTEIRFRAKPAVSPMHPRLCSWRRNRN